jgi:hypothetical protein
VVALAPVGAVNGHAHAPLEGDRELPVRQARDALAVHQVGARGAVAVRVGQRAGGAQADAGDPATLPREGHGEDRGAIRHDHGALPVAVHLDRREPAEARLTGDRDGDIGQELQAAGAHGHCGKAGERGRKRR